MVVNLLKENYNTTTPIVNKKHKKSLEKKPYFVIMIHALLKFFDKSAVDKLWI